MANQISRQQTRRTMRSVDRRDPAVGYRPLTNYPQTNGKSVPACPACRGGYNTFDRLNYDQNYVPKPNP